MGARLFPILIKVFSNVELQLCVGNRLYMGRSKVFLAISLMTWSLTAVVLSNAYTGKIVSNLLIPKLRPVIDSLEQLPSSPLNWFISSGTTAENLFQILESDSFTFEVIYSAT